MVCLAKSNDVQVWIYAHIATKRILWATTPRFFLGLACSPLIGRNICEVTDQLPLTFKSHSKATPETWHRTVISRSPQRAVWAFFCGGRESNTFSNSGSEKQQLLIVTPVMLHSASSIFWHCICHVSRGVPKKSQRLTMPSQGGGGGGARS